MEDSKIYEPQEEEFRGDLPDRFFDQPEPRLAEVEVLGGIKSLCQDLCCLNEGLLNDEIVYEHEGEQREGSEEGEENEMLGPGSTYE